MTFNVDKDNSKVFFFFLQYSQFLAYADTVYKGLAL